MKPAIPMLPAAEQIGAKSRAGVTVFGHWVGAFGFASHTRQFSAALAKIEDVLAAPLDITRTAPRLRKRREDDRIGLGIGPIETMTYVSGRCRIGFVVWETTVVPREKLRILRKLDEIWVPSHWGRRVFLDNGLPEDRVHVVPEGVDPALFHPAGSSIAPLHETTWDEGTRDEGTRPFRFLCVAKWETRKGNADLARAFAREFKPNEPVELIFRCSYHGANPAEALASLDLPPHPPIRITTRVPFSRLSELYSTSDVMVLPTKAEGWGLPILEALSCGIPVIATNYSGHTEFLNDANGYLIDVASMVKVEDPAFYWEEDVGVWAQPDLDHLQALMRRSFENPTERRRKGVQGRSDVLERWTWDHAAQIAQQRLRAGWGF